MGYKMKYTNGKKADISAFPFKIDAPSATSDSPAKLDAGSGMSAGAGIGAGLGSIVPGLGTVVGAGIGAGAGLIAGGIAERAKTNREYKQYKDEIKDAGLERNFFGKIGFRGGNTKAREQLIRDLQEQDQMGIDRERIESRGGVTAGA
tara:strand:+ start:174 stop:617 length:444 start_codon:yes stop_codon:yes gene_type:complete